MRSLLYSLLVTALTCMSAHARTTTNATHAPLSFIENLGQVKDQHNAPRSDVQFMLRASGLRIFIGNAAIHYQFSKPVSLQPRNLQMHGNLHSEEPPAAQSMYRMDVELVGANRNAQMITAEPAVYYENHIAAGPSGSDITAHSYGRITYKNVYPDIDWVLYTNNGTLKHEFVVRPGGNPADIKLRYGGATSLSLAGDGSLTAVTPMGTITEHAPISYDGNNRPISSSFILHGNILQYSTASYSGILTIDPSLVWATYYGGTSEDVMWRASRSSAGDIYTTGITNSTTGMVTTGAHQTVHAGSDDAILTKHDASGNLIWATYYGGSANDRGWECTVDPSGNIYMCGRTGSTSGIATSGTHQPTLTGFTDGFLAKFNSSGARIWATYYGGYDWETASGVTCDASGNVFLIGQTSSTSNIASFAGWQTIIGGGDDGFVAKFTSAGVRLWGTYNGGPNNDEFYRGVTDAAGNIYLGGMGTSPSGVASAGAHQTVYGGGVKDAIFAKFNSSGTRLWCTYFGGSGDEYCWAITKDGAGDIYFGGTTSSAAAISTPGAHQTVYGGSDDGFICKFSSSGTIIWGTYYGGSAADGLGDLTTDPSGNLFILGGSSSTSGIATPGAMSTTISGSGDGYYGAMLPSGSLLYASYFGGNNSESPYSIINDGSGYIYVSGFTNSTAGLTTPGAYQPTYGGGTYDGFLLKIFHCTVPVVAPVTGTPTVCVTANTTLSSTTPSGTWSSGNTAVATVSSSGVVTGVAGGTAIISYGVADACGIGYATVTVTVIPTPTVAAVTGTSTVCVAASVLFSCGTPSGVWSSGSPSIATVSGSGSVLGVAPGTSVISYTVTGACGSTSATRIITVNGAPTVSPITGTYTVCPSAITVLSATPTGGTWSSSNTAVGTVMPTSSDGFIMGVAPGTTTISYVVTGSCGSTTVTAVVTVNATTTVSPITGPSTVCVGSSITLFSATPGGSWSSLAPSVAGVSSGGVVNGLAAGTATIRYSVTGACGAAPVTTVVTVTPLPTVSPIVGSPTVCAGSITVLGSPTPGGTWSSSATGTATVVGGTVTGIAGGTANISYTVSNSCGSISATMNVTVIALPVATITGTTNVCAGSTISLSGTMPGGTWLSSAGSIATVSTSGIVSGIAAGTATISYIVMNTCGSDTATHTVTVLSASGCATDLAEVSTNKTLLTAWPSPSTGVFTVKLATPENEEMTVIITDIAGRQIETINARTNSHLAINIAVPGMYFISARTQTDRYVTKVIIQ